MSKKTLTTFEALKANETKRVRARSPGGTWGMWWGVKELIMNLNRGEFPFVIDGQWEAEEPLVEQWVVVDDEGKVTCSGDTEEEAARYANGCRIVHLREVRS